MTLPIIELNNLYNYLEEIGITAGDAPVLTEPDLVVISSEFQLKLFKLIKETKEKIK